MIYENPRSGPAAPPLFRAAADRPLAMLERCPAYAPTPLRALPALAAELGVGALLVKDETARMGLGSFKALGGVFAIAQLVAEAGGGDDPMTDAAQAAAAGMTFVTASAGNHGLSVAAGARIFGAKAVIMLDSCVPERFAERIRGKGASVERVAGGYEDAVAAAGAAAEARGWLLLADGSWEGYVARPALVMEGYAVLAEECRRTFAGGRAEGADDGAAGWPDHVLLQAGVGGLAAAVARHIRETWPVQPRITVVEPDAAACLQESVRAGSLTRAEGPVSTMGRLDCKDASLIAFESLRQDADAFVTVSDAEAAAAVDRLARHGLDTTPSGAAPVAALAKGAASADASCMIIVSETS
jgi:diaminopropionate ammonia-lyase